MPKMRNSLSPLVQSRTFVLLYHRYRGYCKRKSLAEFWRTAAKSNQVRFSARHVRAEKHRSACKRAGFQPVRCSRPQISHEGAQRGGSLMSIKKPPRISSAAFRCLIMRSGGLPGSPAPEPAPWGACPRTAGRSHGCLQPRPSTGRGPRSGCLPVRRDPCPGRRY